MKEISKQYCFQMWNLFHFEFAWVSHNCFIHPLGRFSYGSSFGIHPKCISLLVDIIYTQNSSCQMGSNLTMKITFFPKHRLLGFMLLSSIFFFIWLVNFTHHHPFKFQMMIHPCIDISHSMGLNSTLFIHITHTHTHTKHKVGAQNLSNCFQNVSEEKTLEASLKWFSPKVKIAIKSIPQ